jgi:hypothetical protein
MAAAAKATAFKRNFISVSSLTFPGFLATPAGKEWPASSCPQ